MCLYTIQTQPRIADKDITVYKKIIMKIDCFDDGKVTFLSPYAPNFTKFNYHKGLNVPDRDSDWDETKSFSPNYTYNKGLLYAHSSKVDKGWLHAYINKIDAIPTSYEIEKCEDSSRFYVDGVRLQILIPGYIKMTIPKGSKYIIGLDGDICSDKLYWDEKEEMCRF